MASTEIVNQDQAIERLNQRLAELKAKSEIAVTDQASFIQAAETKVEFESYIRAVEHHFEPEVAPLEEKLSMLKLQMSALIVPAKRWLGELIVRRKSWAEQERRRAEEEQRRVREERAIAEGAAAEKERKERERHAEVERKAREKEIEAQRKAGELKAREADRLRREAREAEEREKARAAEAEKEAKAEAAVQTVTVAPAIPTVAGIANRRNWKFRVVDEGKIPHIFLMANLVAIGQEVRRLKDKKKAEDVIPGIEVWSE